MHNISLNHEVGAVFRANNCVVSIVMNITVVCCIHVAGAWMRIYCVHVIIMVFVVVVYCNVSGPGWIECVPPVMEIVVSDQNIGSRRPAEWKASLSFPRRYPCNRLQQNAVLGRCRLLIFLPIWLLEKQNRQSGSFVYLEVWIERKDILSISKTPQNGIIGWYSWLPAQRLCRMLSKLLLRCYWTSLLLLPPALLPLAQKISRMNRLKRIVRKVSVGMELIRVLFTCTKLASEECLETL